MVGAIVFVIVMVLVVPVGIMFGGAIWSALFGWLASGPVAEPAVSNETAPDAVDQT
jgi:hypothetical protein